MNDDALLRRTWLGWNGNNSLATCRPRVAYLLIFSIFFGLGAATSVLIGQDANWDLKNYHLYLGWAALNGRFGSDLLNLQTYFYPTLDIPYTWLALGLLADHPRILAAFMGLWYGALIAIVWMLACGHYSSWTRGRRLAAISAGTLVASTGTATITQVGTTYNEIQVSVLVLAALLIAQNLIRKGVLDDRCARDERLSQPLGRLLCIGALLGIATGLKFTASIYSPTLCLALITVLPLRQWLLWCCFIVIGWLPAFTVSVAPWAWKLCGRFGNPIFPLFNGIFRSDWYPAANFSDSRFLPHTAWEWLFYPFTWIHTQSNVIELPFRDPRGAVVLLLGIIAAFFAVARRIRLKSRAVEMPLAREQRMLLAFLVTSYVLWLSTTSILRYAIPIEVTGALSIPLLVGVLSSQLPRTIHRAAWVAVTTGLIPLFVFATRYPNLQRAPYRSPAIHADLSWLAPDTMVILAGTAISYVFPFLPAETRTHVVGIDTIVMEARGFRLYDEVVKRIRLHRGPFTLLWDPNEVWIPTMVEQAGLSLEMNNCRDVKVTIGAALQPLKACGGRLFRTPKLSSEFWKEAAHHYKRIEVHEQWPPRWYYPSFARAAGKAAHDIEIIDGDQKLWPLPEFGAKIHSDTLYILDTPASKDRAARIAKPSSDMLSEIDNFLVLAPGWKNLRPEAATLHKSNPS